jgi:hypothetical protein
LPYLIQTINHLFNAVLYTVPQTEYLKEAYPININYLAKTKKYTIQLKKKRIGQKVRTFDHDSKSAALPLAMPN